MATGITSPTSSSAIALLTTAVFATAAGIAYWSTASNTATFGTLVLEIIRVIDTTEKKRQKDNTMTNKTNNQNNRSIEENNNYNDFETAFVSWLDLEEDKTNFSHPGKKCITSIEKELSNPHWMSKAIRDALHLVATSTENFKNLKGRSFVEEECYKPSTPSSLRTKSIQKTIQSSKTQYMSNTDETLCEISHDVAFFRSFVAMQNATKSMMDKEPAIREDFFNGVIVDGEHDQWEDEHKYQMRRSLSISSSSSSWSAVSSSVGLYEVNEDDCLVEEEEEVERLLSYLRFVELAKEASLSSLPPSTSSSDSHNCSTQNFLRRGERIIVGTEGYEILRSATMEIKGESDTEIAKVSHTVALHRYRKELVVAVHYDGSPLSTSTPDDSSQMETILISSLDLQQQNRSLQTKASPSNSFFLLDEAVKCLSEEILLRYSIANNVGNHNTGTSFLSSGYSLVLCGHSMGAALVCRLGDMLTNRSRDTILDAFDVQVYAFGPPPCLPSRQTFRPDGDDSIAEYPFITSIVNNHDCVPRWTVSNLMGLRVSLNSLMIRKRRHFERYYTRHTRHYLSTKPTAANTPTAVRRSSPRVPPFSASYTDWRMFWKNDQERNAFFLRDTIGNLHPKYIVPGKVVTIWNHSQDTMIIGAKVHKHGGKNRYPSIKNFHQFSRHQRANRKNYDVLGRLWIDESMFYDHTIEAYRSNLELLLEQVGNTI